MMSRHLAKECLSPANMKSIMREAVYPCPSSSSPLATPVFDGVVMYPHIAWGLQTFELSPIVDLHVTDCKELVGPEQPQKLAYANCQPHLFEGCAVEH